MTTDSIPKLIRSPLYRVLVEYNPFYLISAMCMLFGLFALNDSLDWSPLPHGNLLTLIVTLNVYEAILVALAVFLLRRGVLRDAMWLMLLEAFFLADVGFRSAAEQTRLDGLDDVERHDAELRARSLTYVAATRARDELFVVQRQ